MSHRILSIDGHPGPFLLKNAFSHPRLLVTRRTAPCHHHPELLTEYDKVASSTTEVLCNVHLNDNGWSQAKLPVSHSGLGLSTASDLALPSVPCSCAACNSLVNDISQRIRQRTTMKFVLGWNEILTYLSNLTSKEKWTKFSALQPSTHWLPYSTSIVWPVLGGFAP